MKQFILSLITFFPFISFYAQEIVGAWETNFHEGEVTLKNIVIVSAEGYQVSTWYDADTGEFKGTNGGSWSQEGNTITEVVEFDTEDSNVVGTSVSFDIAIKGDELRIIGADDVVWKRIDNGTPGDLNGAWLMSGRKRDGKIHTRDTARPRKTMKILSGARFQWIAYNTETKHFLGTGGGTYTTIDGKYTENIEFFSRDNSRVGASLEFDYALKDGDWHHSGFSSKGAPLYEIWTLRK